MGISIIDGDRHAALYCTTEMRAFGPVFEDYMEAVNFMEWLDGDPRQLYNDGVLRDLYDDWKLGVPECEL